MGLALALWGVYTIQQTSSNSRVFWIHLLEVCWTFVGSCKHPISGIADCRVSC